MSVMEAAVTGVLDVMCAMGVVGVAMVTGMADVAHGDRTGRSGRPGPLRRGGVALPGSPAYAEPQRAPEPPGLLPRRHAALSRAAHGICVQAAGRGDGA